MRVLLWAWRYWVSSSRWFWFPGGHGRDCAGGWSLDGCCAGGIYRVFAKYFFGFSVALFYLVFYQIDGNILMPRIMGSKIDLHPVVLILSLLIGAKLYGILGMLFAVPVAAVYRVLYKELWHSSDEPRPTETEQ